MEPSARRALLVGPAGTGKTTEAIKAATALLDSGEVDQLLLTNGTHALQGLRDEIFRHAAEWKQGTDGRAGMMFHAHGSHPDLWLGFDWSARWLIVVEDLEILDPAIVELVETTLIRNSASRALFVGRHAPLQLQTWDDRITFDSAFLQGPVLSHPGVQRHLQLAAPSYRLVEEIQRDLSRVDALHWREFETLIATLLERDGYIVEQMRGTKDGGVDVVASMDLGAAGTFKSVWQAKKNRQDRRIGLSVVGELADTRAEHGASKAIIVTTSYLTHVALARVERDRYLLSKIDRDDLRAWVERSLEP